MELSIDSTEVFIYWILYTAIEPIGKISHTEETLLKWALER